MTLAYVVRRIGIHWEAWPTASSFSLYSWMRKLWWLVVRLLRVWGISLSMRLRRMGKSRMRSMRLGVMLTNHWVGWVRRIHTCMRHVGMRVANLGNMHM